MANADSIPEWADDAASRELPTLRRQGEGQYLEYKEVLPEDNWALAKEIAAFANCGGGQILIGVDDDGELRECEEWGSPRGRDETMKLLQGITCNNIRAPLTPQAVFAVENGVVVLVITIPPGRQRPYLVRGKTYVRHITESRQATPTEVQELVTSGTDDADVMSSVSIERERSNPDWKLETYRDLVKPWAKEVGEVAGQLISRVLLPVRAAIWGYDEIVRAFAPSLHEALDMIPEERLQEPRPEIAVPILQALTYTGHETPLKEMFATLLASSMDKASGRRAHPSFVEFIKQMTPDEARICRHIREHLCLIYELCEVKPIEHWRASREPEKGFFLPPESKSVGLEVVDTLGSAIENLERMGLVFQENYPVSSTLPEELQRYKDNTDAWAKKQITAGGAGVDAEANSEYKVTYQRMALKYTTLGCQFAEGCFPSESTDDERAAPPNREP